MADSLLNIFSLDLAYFETYAPVVNDIQNIVIAVGWALLIGNLVFQAMRSMAAGLGFEGEDPVALGTRTFVFAFLLLASRQICAIGLNFTSTIMDLFQVPDAVEIITPDENAFGIDSSWLLAMIVGLILIFQVIKFFFEIGERYVVTVILVVLAPLAFGMGGSKNTEDIFKGWCRMFGSMCVMMLMNVIFLKLLLSTMSTVPSGLGIFPRLIFVTAIVRVGRKIDDIVCRMGLNPAHTGSPLGHGFMALPTMMANHAACTVIQTVAANRTGGGKTPSSGNRSSNRPSSGSAAPGPNPAPSSPPPAGGGTGGSAQGKTAGAASAADSTPPAGTTPKAPNPGTAPASATANLGTAQGQQGAAAPAKGTAQEGPAPTRPPLGRGRKFTPPSAGRTPGQTDEKGSVSTPQTPAATGTPGQPGAPGHPTSQPPAAAAQQNTGVSGQEKAPPLSANTAVSSGVVTAKDGKNAGTPQSPDNPSRPAPAAKPPAGTSARPAASGNAQTNNSSTTSQVQNGPRTHTPAAGVPGAPGTPGHPAASNSNRPERPASKPAWNKTSSPPPQNPAVAPSGVPVRNPGAVSGGTTQHGPSRAPTGVSNSDPSGTSHPTTGTRPLQSNPPAAAPAPSNPKGPSSTPPSRPDAPPRPVTPAAPVVPTNPVQGNPKHESSQRPASPSDRPVKNPPPVREDKKPENGSTHPARPGEPQK
ncbi:hypothetical protein D7Y41_33650 [Anaerotruncus sp. 1XD22-93]|nr:hypothetical protein [Anaerotruncus sp. 1XD42-93]RKJ75165.1 hypothetical protein D7Y41_33650 [Anaerotruncus sp. 1XD22-93]